MAGSHVTLHGTPKYASDNKVGNAVCLKPIARGGRRDGAAALSLIARA